MDRIEKDFQLIFEIMMGDEDPEPPFEWVEDVFASDTRSSRAYADILAARENLCARLGIAEEDEDLERIMNGLMKLEEDLGKRMFLCGMHYARMTAGCQNGASR